MVVFFSPVCSEKRGGRKTFYLKYIMMLLLLLNVNVPVNDDYYKKQLPWQQEEFGPPYLQILDFVG